MMNNNKWFRPHTEFSVRGTGCKLTFTPGKQYEIYDHSNVGILVKYEMNYVWIYNGEIEKYGSIATGINPWEEHKKWEDRVAEIMNERISDEELLKLAPYPNLYSCPLPEEK
jgi:hypothetical protein